MLLLSICWLLRAAKLALSMANNSNHPSISTGLRLPGIDGSTTVIITGGTGAIGYRTAEAFLELGARVAVMSREGTTVDAAAARLSEIGDAVGIIGDVASPDDARRVVEEVLARWGRLDVLVQSAAVGGNNPLEQMDADRIDQMFSINVKGVLLMAKAAAVPMTKQGQGRIINISSIMAHRAMPNGVLYGSSKAAVSYATRALAAELGPVGIRVNCVSPANTPTQVRQVGEEPGTPPLPPTGSGGSAERIPLRRRGQLDDYVGPILFFASELSAYVTGADVLADGGLELLRA